MNIRNRSNHHLLSAHIFFFSIIFDAVQTRTLFLRGVDSPLAAALTVSTALKAITLVLECQSKISILKPECETTLEFYIRLR